MGINISSNYIPAININTGMSVSGTLSVSANSFYNVTNYQTVNITKPEDLLEIRLNTPTKITSYNNDNLTYLAPATFYSTWIETANFPACTSVGSDAFHYCWSLTSVNFPVCTTVGDQAFYNCYKLTIIDFPACTTIGSYAFQACYSLVSISFPACTNINARAFMEDHSLTSVNFPACISVGGSAFYVCQSLTTASFPACTSIGTYAFYGCYNLLSLYLLGSSLCSLAGTDVFISTPISNYTTSTGGIYGSIYVPASLYNSYITATNWVYFSSRFVSV